MNILTVNLLFSTFIFWVMARIYLLPRLQVLRIQSVVTPILLLHSFRHLGLMFLSQGGTYPGIPLQFAYPAALGDLLAAILALILVFLVNVDLRKARSLLWVFNVVGTLDLILAIALATIYHASSFMGPAYWIPALWVPALLVTHYVTFVLLAKHWNRTEVSNSRDHSLSRGRISTRQMSTAEHTPPWSDHDLS